MSSIAPQKSIAKNMRCFRPYGNYISIRIFDPPKASAGGIVLPDNVIEKDKQILAWVISTGPGQLRMDGNGRVECLSKPGDLLIILRHAPIEMKLGGESFHVIAEGDAAGRVDLDVLAELDPEAAAHLQKLRTEVLQETGVMKKDEDAVQPAEA